MSEAVLTVVREWIVKAEHDLTAAAQILTLGKATPTETVGFHAQQCVDKYLKAVLVYRSIPFTKTHVIRALMNLVPQRYETVARKVGFRLVPKLCLGTQGREALLRVSVPSRRERPLAGPAGRSRASRPCVPKQSLGTRGRGANKGQKGRSYPLSLLQSPKRPDLNHASWHAASVDTTP
ncbi:MAG: HEPN domain-containing protein [Planctomycetes bacterium]|nr:HEPN domain-containing protein [Planctomycetota bacterium]